jgi:hypothetical protein
VRIRESRRLIGEAHSAILETQEMIQRTDRLIRDLDRELPGRFSSWIKEPGFLPARASHCEQLNVLI